MKLSTLFGGGGRVEPSNRLVGMERERDSFPRVEFVIGE